MVQEGTPHVAQKTDSAIDGRTTRHAGYAVSLRIRKRVEEVFGWAKTVGVLRKTRLIGLAKVKAQTTFTLAAYNLTRLATIFAWRLNTVTYRTRNRLNTGFEAAQSCSIGQFVAISL